MRHTSAAANNATHRMPTIRSQVSGCADTSAAAHANAIQTEKSKRATERDGGAHTATEGRDGERAERDRRDDLRQANEQIHDAQ